MEGHRSGRGGVKSGRKREGVTCIQKRNENLTPMPRVLLNNKIEGNQLN